MKKKKIKILDLILIAVVINIIISFIYLIPKDYDIFSLSKILNNLENSLIKLRYNFKYGKIKTKVVNGALVNEFKREGVYNNIYIAAIDDEAIEKYGTFPFDRKVYAEILDHFNNLDEKKRPKLILFDIFFNQASLNTESDKKLIDSFNNYKGKLGVDFGLDIISGIELNISEGSQEEIAKLQKKIILNHLLDIESEEAKGLLRFQIEKIPDLKNIKVYPKIISVLPGIINRCDFSGVANMDISGDFVYKKPLIVSTLMKYKDNEEYEIKNVIFPDIVLSTVASLLDVKINDISIEKNKIVLKNATINDKKMDFVIPVDENYNLTINYKSKPAKGFIKYISLAKITRAKLPADSIILIGMYAQGAAHDIWMSPLGKMFGIEHIAYAIGTIINGDFIKYANPALSIMLSLLLSLIIVYFISINVKIGAIAGILSLIAPFGLGLLLFNISNTFIVMIIPIMSVVFTLIISQIIVIMKEQKEKRFIKNTFSSYVSPDVVNIIIQNPDMLQLGGVETEVTVLFSDIRSFTTLSEGMTPTILINFLNRYLTKMTDIVMEYQGTLDKYIGDAVMAFWGAPIPLKDHALKACIASLKMIESLKEFNEEQKKLGQKPISIGIGLNTGVVTVGNVGSDKRKNYTIIGDNVNLGSRLEGVNKYYKTQIVISEFTYEQVKDKVYARELDLLRVKGKNQPVKIYELIDLKE